MKTKIFYIAITTVLSLSTLSVYADGTKGKKESAEIKNTTVSLIISSVKEVEMEMESWMTSLTDYNSTSEILNDATQKFESHTIANVKVNNKYEIFKDDDLVLEDWMMNDFNVNNNTKNFQDDEFILVGWMLESADVNTQEISANVEF